MTQTPKPQTKFNAKRSADAATRRTEVAPENRTGS